MISTPTPPYPVWRRRRRRYTVDETNLGPAMLRQARGPSLGGHGRRDLRVRIEMRESAENLRVRREIRDNPEPNRLFQRNLAPKSGLYSAAGAASGMTRIRPD